jgi:acetyltransferase-like isoleucine patch superfamily enzyme
MSRTTALTRIRPLLRPAGRPIKRALGRFTAMRLRWVYLRDDIDGVAAELRKLRTGHADVLRQFGASVAKDAMIVGPLSIVNARRDFSNLQIGARTHVGSEVFFDLAERITVEDGATISMRAVVITHFDAGRSALAERRPRQTGPVTIGKDAYLGAGATILHGVTVGEAALVGAGAVVAKDVEPGAVVVVPSPRSAQPAPTEN